MFQVRIHSGDKTADISLEKKTLVSDLFSGQRIFLDMPCGGRGKCLKCRVRASGTLSAPTETERGAIPAKDLDAGVRLACQTYVTGDAEISVIGNEKSAKIISRGYMPEFKKQPLGSHFGIAVDIGTTTVAAYLYRLSDCSPIDSGCAANPQKSYGADVISRIGQSMAGRRKQLAQAVTGCIEELSLGMCREANVSPSDVDCFVMTGNTAMLFLLTETDVECLACAPFEASTLFGTYAEKDRPRIESFPSAKIYLPRCISAYVGADITTAILSSEMTDSDDCSVLVDIGTNGEMALRFSDRLWCCSTAAGPAFEGSGITMGMNATEGAVDHVFVKDGALEYTTIGNGEACGICGSGIIDALAALLSVGVVDETGLMRETGHACESQMTNINGFSAFRFKNSSVAVTQKDVRAVQLAKSAICAGLKTLLHEASLDADGVVKFYIAGGFGNYINIKSAVKIGLFPPELESKAFPLGNAAGMGASMILLSRAMQEKSLRIARKAETVELSTSPYFMDAYIDGMMF